LTLFGRSDAKLAKLAEDCSALGATVACHVFDVRDHSAAETVLRDVDAEWPIDLLFANAGVGGGKAMAGPSGEVPANARLMIDVNFGGVVSTCGVVAPLMMARGKGRIVIISSLSGLAPMPMAPGYSASKAGVSAYAASLRLMLHAHGVAVTLIEPGFIDTPMSAEVPGPQPLKVDAAHAAGLIAKAVEGQQKRVAFPRRLALLTRIAAWLPDVAMRWFHSAWRIRGGGSGL
jgi:short-subunit dehydrogenase